LKTCVRMREGTVKVVQAKSQVNIAYVTRGNNTSKVNLKILLRPSR
jgi:hypothetical protein